MDMRYRMRVYYVILNSLIISQLAQAVTPACNFGDMNPPPSTQQYVTNQYYLTNPTLSIPIGTFTGTACSGVFSYRISNIKDVNGLAQIVATFPITITTLTPITINVASSDSSLIALSPFKVEIEASCISSSCRQYQYILVTFMDTNTCSLAPLSINPSLNGVQAQSITETTPGTVTLNLFTYNAASYPGCYSFT